MIWSRYSKYEENSGIFRWTTRKKLIERQGTGKVVFQSYVLRKTETEGLVRIEGI